MDMGQGWGSFRFILKWLRKLHTRTKANDRLSDQLPRIPVASVQFLIGPLRRSWSGVYNKNACIRHFNMLLWEIFVALKSTVFGAWFPASSDQAVCHQLMLVWLRDPLQYEKPCSCMVPASICWQAGPLHPHVLTASNCTHFSLKTIAR